jgi:hypothetical protein
MELDISIMLAIEDNAVTGFTKQITSCLSVKELALYISLTEKINANCIPKEE